MSAFLSLNPNVKTAKRADTVPTKLEMRAREIAARDMGLMNDPHGLKVADVIWRKYLLAARREEASD